MAKGCHGHGYKCVHFRCGAGNGAFGYVNGEPGADKWNCCQCRRRSILWRWRETEVNDRRGSAESSGQCYGHLTWLLVRIALLILGINKDFDFMNYVGYFSNENISITVRCLRPLSLALIMSQCMIYVAVACKMRTVRYTWTPDMMIKLKALANELRGIGHFTILLLGPSQVQGS